MVTSDIAIIGDGPAALACFAQLRAHGVPANRIAVYGDSPHPLARLEQYARGLGQRVMRSEGNGHLSPTEFPGLAVVDAWRRRSPWPLLAALFDCYQPSLDLLIAHFGGSGTAMRLHHPEDSGAGWACAAAGGAAGPIRTL